MSSDETNETVILDPDDPSLQEAQNYDPEADYNAYVPPPTIDANGDPIVYQLKLKIGANKPYGTKDAYYKRSPKAGTFGVLRVDIEIVQPGSPFDKYRLYSDRMGSMYPTTIIDKVKKTSPVLNLCRILGSSVPKGQSIQQQCKHLVDLLSAEPLQMGTLQWSAWCGSCEETISDLRGEHNWPTDSNGGHKAKTTCPACHSDLTARAEFKEFLEA